MKLFRYWAFAETAVKDDRGRSLKIRKWAGSNESIADAKDIAARLARAIAARIAGTHIGKKKHYEYSTRDVPEEVIGEITEAGGVTRNRIGCLVLNVAAAMFVDIDQPLKDGFWAKLFGIRDDKYEGKYLARLDTWVRRNPGTGARVYRTAGGLRYLFTHAPVLPDEQAMACMNELGADVLYIRLCKAQNCYRARLSPKPWRIEVSPINTRYPRETPKQQDRFRKWLADYEKKSSGFAVCQFVKSVGNADINEDLASIVKDHDRATKAQASMPLA